MLCIYCDTVKAKLKEITESPILPYIYVHNDTHVHVRKLLTAIVDKETTLQHTK